MNSLIFRGLVTKSLHKSVELCRSWQDTEIILSTWEDQYKLLKKETVDLFDEIVLAKPPSDINSSRPSMKTSPKQVAAYNNGVKASSGDLIAISRTDMVLSKNLFDLYKKKKAFGDMRVFSNKLLIGNIMTINPDFGHPSQWGFRAGDWFQCGEREDIQFFADVGENMAKFSKTPFGTEQCWAFSLLTKKNINIEVDRRSAWQYILGNYSVLDTKSSAGVIPIGKWENQPEYSIEYLTERLCEDLLKV
tara:strand:- start:3368 stop:4111 length:744 start_codon:yes stop_codon:yes gene_type:complete